MNREPKFSTGTLVITPAAAKAAELEGIDPQDLLARHVRGDWGNLDEADRQCNDEAMRTGLRIFSAYKNSLGDWFTVVTEADRSLTTIYLSSEA